VGQRCEVSASSDLTNWRSLGEFILTAPQIPLPNTGLPPGNVFYRVTQSLPAPPATIGVIETTTTALRRRFQ